MYSIWDLLCAIGASATLTCVPQQIDGFTVLFTRMQRRPSMWRAIATTVKLNIFQCRSWTIASEINEHWNVLPLLIIKRMKARWMISTRPQHRNPQDSTESCTLIMSLIIISLFWTLWSAMVPYTFTTTIWCKAMKKLSYPMVFDSSSLWEAMGSDKESHTTRCY